MAPSDPQEHERPLSWREAFAEECRRLNPAFQVPPPAAHDDEGTRIASLNRAAFAEDRAALCLSGGGIRSASLSIGVLQALAHRGLLQGFDYLSTVSGGGFAGGWLSAWLHRAGQLSSTPTDRPALSGGPAPSNGPAPAGGPAPIGGPALAGGPALTGGPAPHSVAEALARFRGQATLTADTEPWPVGRLRQYTRYLSPQTGFLSADFWGLVATMLRNTVLNWAVLLPLLGAMMLVPRFQFALIHLLEQEPGSASSIFVAVDVWALAIAFVSYGLALIHVVANLPSYGNRGDSEPQFVLRCLAPLSIGTLALVYYWASWGQFPLTRTEFAQAGAVLNAAIWAVVGFLTGKRPFRPRTWAAAAVSGAIGGAVYEAILTGLFNYDNLARIYVTFSFPLIMVAMLTAAVVFVGLAGYEMSESDLEWWSRAAGWVLIVAAGWLIVCAVAFGIPMLFDWLAEAIPGAFHTMGGMAAVLGGLTSWLLRPAGESGALPSWPRRLALALVAPVAVLLIIGGVATLDRELVKALTNNIGPQTVFLAPFQRWPVCRPEQEADYSGHRCHPADGGFGETAVAFLVLLGLGLITSRLVPANKFSLHDMYLHRLTRAYLGASRHERHPNPFTGFDPDDDVELAALADQRPLHIVNTTLNMKLNARLGRQESQALSFTMTPLHCGSHALEAYRPSREFAANPLRKCGISLGSAVTISGAAASPQMGDFTSPALAFLLAMFNARLGVWLGNPGPAGADTWRGRDPKARIAPIVREMFGGTTDANPYVYLSDGGHFDNLGLWEMILRRVRHIVVIDNGCDGDYRFEDLAAAVRRARVDHGAEIEFDATAMQAMRTDAVKPHVVTGTIRYLEAPAGDLGTIVYIKPVLSNDEPVDVVTYGKAHPEFPHESTANQFFTDAQFESYRALGFHSVQAALADTSAQGLGTLAPHLIARQVTASGAV